MRRAKKPPTELRRRAERELAKRDARREPRLPSDALRLVHELEVHQIELEMQNEELREARLENEAALRRYAELFDFAPIGYVVVDARGAIREANLEAARMLGVPRRQLSGRQLHSFLAEEYQPALAALLSGVFEPDGEGPPSPTRDVVLSADGAEVRLVASVRAGEPHAMVAFNDVSARKRAERALFEQNVHKDEFMAALSHELRNPLAPIGSSLAVLARASPESDEARRALAVAERQLAQLVHIVDDLLDVTRISQGKIRLAREQVELGELVRAIVEDHRRELDVRGIAVEARLGPDRVWVDGDRTRLAQVIGNLLGNALKFTPHGGHIDLALRREGGHAVLTVGDDGAGIAPGMLPRLFEPFVQAPQTIDRTPGGLGLGLATVKGLVERHGGSVEVSSGGLGRGSRFTIQLPVAEGPKKAKAPTPHAPAAEAAKQSKRRVLVIDDNIDSADAMVCLLGLEGHDVRAAYDGPAGLALAAELRPEIVFCDIGLPGMDGYEVARAMRAEAALGGPYLVALSGYARPEDRKRSAEAGFDLHLAKPPSVDALERALAKARPVTPPRPASSIAPGPSPR